MIYLIPIITVIFQITIIRTGGIPGMVVCKGVAAGTVKSLVSESMENNPIFKNDESNKGGR